MARGRFDYGQVGYSNPFASMQSSLADMQNRGLEERKLEAEQEQRDLANKRADAQLKMLQDAADREAKKYQTGLDQEAALTSIALDYSKNPYGAEYGTESAALDKEVIDNISALTPSYMKATGNEIPKESMVPAVGADGKPIPGKMMPALDQSVFNAQVALQKQYEEKKPFQQDAYNALVAKAKAANVPIKDATTLATSLTAGLDSRADNLKSATKTAEDYNKRQELKYKEENKLYLAGKRKGTGFTGDPMTALAKINPDQWVGGDRKDALASMDGMRATLKNNKWAPKDINKVLSNALTYSSGQTDWTNDDVEFNDSMFKDYMTRAIRNPEQAVAEFDTGVKPALPAQMTGDKIVAMQKSLADKADVNRFNDIIGTKPNSVKDNLGGTSQSNSPISVKDSTFSDFKASPTEIKGDTYLDKATNLLVGFEGFKPNAYHDVDKYRVGYGSDTITKADGTVVKVKKGDVVNKEDAARDLKRRLPEFEKEITTSFGKDTWATFDDNMKASLLSFTYNYGIDKLNNEEYAAPFREAMKSKDPIRIADAMVSLSHQNKGINAQRRYDEAGPLYTTNKGSNEIKPGTPEHAEQLRKIKATMGIGGSVTEDASTGKGTDNIRKSLGGKVFNLSTKGLPFVSDDTGSSIEKLYDADETGNALDSFMNYTGLSGKVQEIDTGNGIIDISHGNVKDSTRLKIYNKLVDSGIVNRKDPLPVRLESIEEVLSDKDNYSEKERKAISSVYTELRRDPEFMAIQKDAQIAGAAIGISASAALALGVTGIVAIANRVAANRAASAAAKEASKRIKEYYGKFGGKSTTPKNTRELKEIVPPKTAKDAKDFYRNLFGG